MFKIGDRIVRLETPLTPVHGHVLNRGNIEEGTLGTVVGPEFDDKIYIPLRRVTVRYDRDSVDRCPVVELIQKIEPPKPQEQQKISLDELHSVIGFRPKTHSFV